MKPLPIAVVVAVILALLWWFWPRGATQPPATAESAKALVASTPAPAPAAPAPKVEPPPPPPPPPPLTATVYFEFDRSALQSGDLPALDDFVAKLKDRNYSSVAVVGYADRIGEAPHNDTLSRKRADAAVAYLTSKGVDASRSKAEGKGENGAVTGDACKDMGAESGNNRKLVDCLQKDRRVEIAVVN